jgi:hypothetical protein
MYSWSLYSLYLQVHPDARSYRIKSIPYYSDLCMIYGNVTTEQKGDYSSLDATLKIKIKNQDPGQLISLAVNILLLIFLMMD